ncbi:MAG: ABC transporter permease [Spirochaetes bacterium]|nr:ABC transporter permease [Spirochaetota bacterium]
MQFLKQHSIEITLAWRNVWKNKRRTVLTLLTIMVGCAMVIFFISLQEGAYDVIIENSVAPNTTHIQIHEKGFWEDRSIDYGFIPDASITEALKSEPAIAGFSRRISAGGLVISGDTSDIAFIQGVEPSSEPLISTLHEAVMKGGRYLAPGDTDSVIIGETMAKNLDVEVGGTLSFLSQGFDGSFAGAPELTVVGIFRTGNPEYDRMLLLMPFDRAVEMFSMGEYVTAIAIRLNDGTMMPEIRERLKKAIPSEDLEIMGWDDLMPELMQYVIMDRVGAYVFYFVLYLTVAFGVLNTVQMSVFERTREFGVMLAIGTRPGQILAMVTIESFIISILGIILGCIVGGALAWYFMVFPLDYTSYQKELEVWGFTMTKVPAKIAFSYFLETSLIIFIISMLFTIMPARRAARLQPVRAIRTL